MPSIVPADSTADLVRRISPAFAVSSPSLLAAKKPTVAVVEGMALGSLPLPAPGTELLSAGAATDHLLGRTLAEIERYYIEKTLELAKGNREEAARILNIGERTLYRTFQRWKEEDEKKRTGNTE